MISGGPAPVVLFVYNRPAHTARTLAALAANSLAAQSELHVFCDGPKDGCGASELSRIQEVRDIVRSRSWCGEVIVHEREVNFGLAGSVRHGVDHVLARHDKVVVIEDDIETSPGFLQYMNDALGLYADREYVMHVAGYLPATSYEWTLPETFLARYMSCWGWGTWSRAWKRARWNAAELLAELDARADGRRRFDLDGSAAFSAQLDANLRGELHTWAIYWGVSVYLADGLCLFPGRTLVRNTGTDGTGENFRTDQGDRYAVSLASSVTVKAAPNRESLRGRAYLRAFHRHGKDSGLGKRVRLALGRSKHRMAEGLRQW